MNNFVLDYSKRKPSSPLLYGMFFEDINHALDGGLNANLVQNGSFDFCHFNYGTPNVKFTYDHLRFWKILPSSCFSISNNKKISANKPYSIKLNLNGMAVLKNCGYEIENGKNYIFTSDSNFTCSFFYISNKPFKLNCYLEYENGKTSEIKTINLKPSATYKLVEIKLTAIAHKLAKLCFEFEGNATIYLTHFKLIPFNFYKTSKNKYKYGKFNPQLVDALNYGAKFLRFPGGCVVEGDVELDYLYEWEKTIGPTETRASKPSVWSYLQSNEIGFFEYFCLCEDLHLSPLPVHHVGLICQIRTEVFGHRGYIAYEPSSREFKEKVINSVAHLIYFAKGDIKSPDKTEKLWANKRAEMGHKKPFNLNMIALGNENWDSVYFRNFEACVNALKNYIYCGKKINLLEKFNIQILSSAGTDINPQDTNPSWRYLNQNHHELIVDEHVYNTPTWFIDNFYRYDYYNPTYSKVFMGEYASHTRADGKGILGGTNNFTSALSEAVFICGMENNPDVVKLSCYAPLLCKAGQANWDPDLIYFDRNKINFTPNYHVQSLFAQNYGKFAVKLDCERDFSNAGSFELNFCQNALKDVKIIKNSKNICNFNENFKKSGQKFEINKKLENFSAYIEFEKLKDNFNVVLGGNKSQGFKYILHYEPATQNLYYEKVVNNLRMTYEHLAHVKLTNKIKIEFTNEHIKVYNVENQNEVKVASKHIWKVNTNIFSSLTFDNKKIYLKVINVGKASEQFNLKIDEKLKPIGSGTILTLTENKVNETKITKTQKQIKFKNNDLSLSLNPKSINIIVLDK